MTPKQIEKLLKLTDTELMHKYITYSKAMDEVKKFDENNINCRLYITLYDAERAIKSTFEMMIDQDFDRTLKESGILMKVEPKEVNEVIYAAIREIIQHDEWLLKVSTNQNKEIKSRIETYKKMLKQFEIKKGDL